MKLVKRLLLDLDFELAVFKITAGKKTDQIGQLAAVEFIGECYAQDIGIRSAVNGRNFGCSLADGLKFFPCSKGSVVLLDVPQVFGGFQQVAEIVNGLPGDIAIVDFIGRNFRHGKIGL